MILNLAMRNTRFISIIAFFFSVFFTEAQTAKIELWPNGIPNRVEVGEQEISTNNDILWITKVQTPWIEVFQPPARKSTGMAVLIMPGGGYAGLAYDWEGSDVAKWFNIQGVTAFVLKYRVPLSASVTNKHLVPLQDAQRAMRIIRSRAKEWGVDTNKIGVMGFSAGGHLAASLGTHYDYKIPFEKDEIENSSAKPDFLMLIYPVISMKKELTHMGSHDNLLGNSPNQEMTDFYSNEMQVSAESPPTFLLHATDDDVVMVENSLAFYKALKTNGVNVEMHIFPKGGHGFGLGTGNPVLAQWPNLLDTWLKTVGQ